MPGRRETSTARIDIFHHFPDPVHLMAEVDTELTVTSPVRVVTSDGPPWIRASIAVSTKQEAPMPAQITVDDVGKKFHMLWTDDQGDANATPPAAGAAAYSVVANADGSMGALAVTADATDPFACDYVPGPDGDVSTLAATFNGSAFEPDGVTPIPDPANLVVTTGPGGAVSATIAEE